MAAISQQLADITVLSIVVRILLSTFCAGTLGFERERHNQAAGFRTYIIVSDASALVMMTNIFVAGLGETDLVRMSASVITGLGFLGAGTIIITARQQVKGLTTAAGLWAAAIIGLVCGAGYVEFAIFATAVVLLVEVVLVRLETRLTSKSTDLTLYIEYAHAVCMESVLALLRERSIRIDNLEISRIADSDAPDAPHHYCALIPIHSRTPLQPGDLRGDLTALPDMLAVEEM